MIFWICVHCTKAQSWGGTPAALLPWVLSNHKVLTDLLPTLLPSTSLHTMISVSSASPKPDLRLQNRESPKVQLVKRGTTRLPRSYIFTNLEALLLGTIA